MLPGAQAAALRDGQGIDPNRATAAEFELLPGVGPSLARRLVEARTAQGPFRSAQDLRRVKGVGVKTLARFERFLRFGSEQVEHPTAPQLGLVGAGHVPGLEDDPNADVEAHAP
ncbi:MAG: helix-hairpin-helix domain-containing protein [Myxococcales bacterium]